MAFRVQDDVLRLEVSVYDPVTMQALQGEYDLCCVESCSILVELRLLSQVEEQLATVEEVDDEVETLWCLECIMELYYEGMVDSFKDHALN